MKCSLLLLLAALALSPAHGECRTIEGLDALLEPGRVLLLGEMHGTEQSPTFAFSAACAASAAGHDTVVGLELAAAAQPSVDRYLVSGGTPEDRDALLDQAMWQRDYQDGRNSRAMVELIEQLRALRAQGRSIAILFFDSPATGGGPARDRRMGERLAASAKARPEAIHVVLSGNIHSRVAPGIRGNPDYEPMGRVLREQLGAQRVVALNVGHAGGDAWLCSPECGVVGLAGHSTGEAWSIEIDDETRPSGHDGWYHVGALTASLPAVGDHELPVGEPPAAVERAESRTESARPRRTESADSPQVAKLQGKWQSWQNGLKSWWIEFDGRDFYGEMGPDDWYRGKIFVRSGEPHSEIDLLIEDCVCGFKGSSSDGIYRWEGDEVRLAAPTPGDARPTGLDGERGDIVLLRRLED
jgi:hypothetical protein